MILCLFRFIPVSVSVPVSVSDFGHHGNGNGNGNGNDAAEAASVPSFWLVWAPLNTLKTTSSLTADG